jgi:ribosome recycling factor
VRRDGNEVLKKLEKDHVVSQDEHRKYTDEVQKMTDQYIAKVDEALKHKESEITQI